jgi:predicted Zn-dependent peptidase
VFDRTVLSNGLRILSSTMPHTRSVSVGIFVGAGSRYEDDPIAGASHYLEHVLFKGTERRPEPQMISGAIESVGGIMNASTDREATVYYAKVARDHFPLALDVLSDMILHPLFAEHEIERERGVIIEELSMTYDQPDAYVDMLIDEVLWPKQAMGRDIGGTRETVGAISRQALMDYHKVQYVPGNVVVAVAGNVTHEEVVNLVGEQMGSWRDGEPLTMKPVKRNLEGPVVSLGNKKTDQAHICLALDGVSADSDDRYSLDMMNAVLGEGMTSRLFMEIRERRGLAYEVHSSSMHYKDCGALVIYSGVDTTKAEETITAMIDELQKMTQGVSEEELNRSIEFAVGRLDLRLEDTRAVMSWIGGQELLRSEVLEPDEVVTALRCITTSEVMKAAKTHLTSGKLRLAIVGPYRSGARFKKLLT